MAPPTAEELFDPDETIEKMEESLDRWRHGYLVYAVYRRKTDMTYWKATYTESTDGETNGLRDGGAKIVPVIPRSDTVVTYEEAADASA